MRSKETNPACLYLGMKDNGRAMWTWSAYWYLSNCLKWAENVCACIFVHIDKFQRNSGWQMCNIDSHQHVIVINVCVYWSNGLYLSSTILLFSLHISKTDDSSKCTSKHISAPDPIVLHIHLLKLHTAHFWWKPFGKLGNMPDFTSVYI